MCFLLPQANPQKAEIKIRTPIKGESRRECTPLTCSNTHTHTHLWTYAGVCCLNHLNLCAVVLREVVWKLCAALAPTRRGEMWHWRIWRSTWLFSQPRTKLGWATNNWGWNAVLSIERNMCVHTYVWLTVTEKKTQFLHLMSLKKSLVHVVRIKFKLPVWT